LKIGIFSRNWVLLVTKWTLIFYYESIVDVKSLFFWLISEKSFIVMWMTLKWGRKKIFWRNLWWAFCFELGDGWLSKNLDSWLIKKIKFNFKYVSKINLKYGTKKFHISSLKFFLIYYNSTFSKDSCSFHLRFLKNS
jgi:hypothetical protein